MKVDVECFGFKNLLQDFEFMKIVVKIAMDNLGTLKPVFLAATWLSTDYFLF